MFMYFLGSSLTSIDYHGFIYIFMDFHRFLWFSMDLKGSGARMLGGLWSPENLCAAGLDPPNIKISDSGGLDLDSAGLDAWMLEGLEWIGGGDGEDWNGRRGLEEILTRSSFRSSAD